MKVLITDRFDVEAYALLSSQSSLQVSRSATPQPQANELEFAEALVIRSRTLITKDLLAMAPKLKLIVTATSGFDHIDLDVTTAQKVNVMYTPEANAASAAEMTWALLLACSRRVVEADRAVRKKDWRREALLGRELSGLTYGIVGLGRIGRRVAAIAQAFGMTTVAFDPYCEPEAFTTSQTTRMSLDELMRIADVVSVHVPSTDETRNMITPLLLESMSREAVFVNASRGSIITERTLVTALTERWIAACGLDVFEKEPLSPDSKLLSFTNVVLSPHLGATTGAAFAKASLEAAKKVMAFASTGAVSDSLPPMEAWFQAGFEPAN